MKKIQKIFRFCFTLGILFLCSHCYVLKQAWGQFDILRKRRPIAKVLKDPQTARPVRTKLLFVEKVRRFTEEHMHLKVNKTYTYYTQLEGPVLAWNVIASEKLALRAKYWKFPIVGEIPYLGFFDLEDAQAKAAELRKAGWDTKVNVVAGYSTLGWFDDPLLSSQLNYPDWYLAALLMHECAHATLWFKGDVSFNESFASFVGRQGSILFYKHTGDSKGYQRMLSDLARHKQKRAVYRHYTWRIQRLYASKLKDKIKLQRKKALFRSLEKKLVQRGFRKPRSQDPQGQDPQGRDPQGRDPQKQSMNNVDLISFTHYHSGSRYFLYEFRKCKKEWTCFLKKMEGLKALPKKKRSKVWRGFRK